MMVTNREATSKASRVRIAQAAISSFGAVPGATGTRLFGKAAEITRDFRVGGNAAGAIGSFGVGQAYED